MGGSSLENDISILISINHKLVENDQTALHRKPHCTAIFLLIIVRLLIQLISQEYATLASVHSMKLKSIDMVPLLVFTDDTSGNIQNLTLGVSSLLVCLRKKILTCKTFISYVVPTKHQ